MQKDSAKEPDNSGVSFSGSDIIGVLFVIAAAGEIYLGFRKKKMQKYIERRELSFDALFFYGTYAHEVQNQAQ